MCVCMCVRVCACVFCVHVCSVCVYVFVAFVYVFTKRTPIKDTKVAYYINVRYNNSVVVVQPVSQLVSQERGGEALP